MNRDLVYREVGKAIGLIQVADSALAHVILLALPESGVHSLTAFESSDKALRKASLGRLIAVLNTRVALESDFDKVLSGYLNDRNTLIHHWQDIDGWSDDKAAIAFCIKVQKEAAFMLHIFFAFLRAWMDQVGINVDVRFPQLQAFFTDIDLDWKPLVDEVFKEKIA